MKTLVLARHAKSDWPGGVADIKRPLKERGQADASRQAALLASQGFKPDLIISSPAVRARQTADIFARQLGYTHDIREERSVYFGDEGDLFTLIKSLPPALNTVMIFGHNPTMEDAITFLLQSGIPFQMPTCGLACLEGLSYSWAQFEGRNIHLRWLLIPRLKRKER
ncbi:MAG: histidine phosphatase family protein [Bacteroidota bacterium]